ncbi:MAG: hypothetical protein ABIR66_08190 [Saprospiraceae bacterium]
MIGWENYPESFKVISYEIKARSLSFPLDIIDPAIQMIFGLISYALAIIIHNYLISISTPLFASANTYFIPIVAIDWVRIAGEKLSVYHAFGMAGLIWSVG